MSKTPKPFGAILADPPWPEQGSGKIKRGADKHYKLMKVRDIPATMTGSGVWRPADDSHLYLWATDNYLPHGLWVMSQLGFRYVRTFCWVKEREDGAKRVGLGQYARGAHELLLFGVRGRGFAVRTDRKDIISVVDEPSWYGHDRVLDAAGKPVHSAKPPLFHQLVESRSRGPYLEMFARDSRPGWTVWGDDESPKPSIISTT